MYFYSRRKFLRDVSFATLAMTGAKVLGSCGAESNENRQLEKQNQKAMGKLGIALVGLGRYSAGQLAPALKETEHCYLAGIVTGTPSKVDKWKKDYDIPDQNVYNYQNFDEIKNNPEIDIIYVVLPNALHAEYVVRAAAAGKHVICEKPMAVTVEDCDKMIKACNEAGKMLSIGYRLHFEPHNKEMMRTGKEKPFGNIIKLKAGNGMSDTEGWRLDKKLAGGGPLMDVGIYCVQGCRYTTGMEPVSITAKETPKTRPEQFVSVEEGLTWQMKFPNGIIAECNTSYSKNMNLLRADCEKGWAELSPAYAYGGIKGNTSEGKMDFPQVNQQARQMDDFAVAIKEKRPTRVPGEMGRQDVKILQAIYQAMETQREVFL